MPIVESRFKPAWWLPGPHLQTAWPSLFQPRVEIDLHWHRLELEDGDFLDLCWPPTATGPVVVLVHGLEGNLQSHYATATLSALQAAGFLPVFMHMRGCSGTPNRLNRSYHSGDTADIASVVASTESLVGRHTEAVIGFSLGGNQLLKWLGESGDKNPLKTAIAISVPFSLADAAARLESGVSRLYQAYLLRKMRASYARRFDEAHPSPLSIDVKQLHSFRAFDDAITAPLNGFAGVDDYYRRASCRQFLAGIRRPTLILHSEDDPFMYPQTVPAAEELSPAVTLELSSDGGHAGFVSGNNPAQPVYWLQSRITTFLKEQLLADH